MVIKLTISTNEDKNFRYSGHHKSHLLVLLSLSLGNFKANQRQVVLYECILEAQIEAKLFHLEIYIKENDVYLI